MTYPKADDASKWKWWYLQRLYDKALSESNIADITSCLIAGDQLLVPVQMIDPMCRRRLQELNDEGLIDGQLGRVSLTDAGCKYVEDRRAPRLTRAISRITGWLNNSHFNGAVAGGVVSAIVVLATASDVPWWWPSDKPESPQQEVTDDQADGETST